MRYLIFAILIFGFAHAQLSTPGSTLLFSDTIAFWPGGIAVIESGKPARIAADGSFSLTLEEPDFLEPILMYEDDNCLTRSNKNSLYSYISFFNLYRNDELFATIFLQTPRFDFELGDAYKEFHFYSEATTVSGTCTVTYDDGFSTLYVFPDLAMQQGWNVLTGTITETSDNSETYTFSLKEAQDNFLWELEAPPLENENDYIGLGIGNDYADAGFLLTEVHAQSPAARAGLLEGDIVTHVNGETVKGMNMGAYLLRMGGSEGEAIALKIIREGAVLDFRVIRGRVIVD